MKTFTNVAVIGFGTMGGGIAQVFAQSGRNVVVLETDESRINAGLAAVESLLTEGVARGEVTAEDKSATLSRLRGTTEVAELAASDLIVEAVTENHQVKSTVLAQVAEVVREDTVIATTTSAFSVSELATSIPGQERFAGLHFFSPARRTTVVEVVRGLSTDEKVIVRLEHLVEEIGKVAVIVKDRPGFLVNKLFMPYINDVIQACDDELASAEDIDVAIKLGLGYKMGPLELVDLIGLDVHEQTTRSVYEATLDPAYAPPPLLQTMVAAGMKGNKNDRGFRTEEKK